jgi:CRP-like cAMP-binding protein/cytochrome P450
LTVSSTPRVAASGSSLAFLRDPVLALPDAARRHGDVFAMRAFGRSFVVVAGATAVQFLQGPDAAKLERRSFYSPFARALGVDEFILGADGEAHRRLRAASRMVYAREILAPHLPRVASAVIARTSVCPDRFALAGEVTRWCLAGYGPALGRIDLGAWERDAQTFSRVALALGVTLLPAPFARLPPYERARDRLRGLAAALIADERRAPSAEPTIAQALCRALDDDELAVGYTLFSVLAVAQYVSRTVAWMLAHVAADPALGAALADELWSHFRPDTLDAPMLRRLEGLRALYRECLRRYPVQAALPYVAREGFHLRGHRVEAGTLVLFAGATGHFDEAVHACPHRMDAERFRRATQAGPAGFVPFGYGDRACTAAGQTELLALTVAASALSTLELRASSVPSAVLDPLPGPNPLRRVTVAARRAIVARIDPVRWAAELVGTVGEPEEDALRRLLGDARLTRIAAGDTVLREGDPADAFYVIQAGRAHVEKGAVLLRTLGPGEFFGELGLLFGGVRTATVRADTAMELLVIDGESFRALVAEGDLLTAEIARLSRRRYMQGCLRQALPKVSPTRLAAQVAEVTAVALGPGEAAVRQGEAADAWYIVGRGRVEVAQRTGDDERVVATLEAGETFGEIGLLRGTPRNATVRADADGAEVLRVPAEAFHAMMAASPESHGDVVASMLARIEAGTASVLGEGT